jgi:hypothetical protein
MKHPISRRAFLRGAGGSLVALPFLDRFRGSSLRSAAAAGRLAAGEFPTRFVVFWTANGTHPTNWFPSGGETDYTMAPYLAPLEPYRDQIMILEGIDMPSAVAGAGDDHQRGIGACLTGTETINSSGRPLAGGISLDQRIADATGRGTKFRSLELGIQSRFNGDTIYERISYRGANQPLPPERDPFSAFGRVFADLDASAESDRQLAERKSVLDFVGADYQRLRGQLGGTDKDKLDAHLSAIREVETRLGVGAPATATCAEPSLGTRFDPNASARFPDVGRLQMDILTLALACDLTRVGSLMWSFGRSKHVFNWLDSSMTEEHHDLSHEQNPDSGNTPNRDAVAKIGKINQFYASQMGYLIQRLQAIPEGGGTLLDNTVILWCNELGEGRRHTHDNIPLLIAGGNSLLRQGRYLRFSGRSTNDLYVTLLNAMGIPDTSFGRRDYNDGPLPGLVRG